MIIKSINWINKNAQEAEVIVTDNSFELMCFSHPFTKCLNQELQAPIYCFDANNIVLAFEKKPYAVKKSDAYDYFIRGKLANKDKKIVLLGSIELYLDNSYIPKDIDEGEYIEFDVSRLDL